MRSKRDNTVVFFILLGLLFVVAAVGGGVYFSNRTTPIDIRNADGHASRAAVRNWLFENLKSGKWEEVKWWPEASLQIGKSTRHFVKARIRSQNSFGGPDIEDFVFEIKGKKVLPVSDSEASGIPEGALEKMFGVP